MATLILNANTASPVSLVVQSAGENAPTEIGTVNPSFAGADRSSVRGVKRNFGALVTYVDTSTKDSIISLLKWGKQIPCSGDLLGNIQTQLTLRYTGPRMIIGGLWEVGLSGNEVQPSVTLLRYSPGDTITGETFTRSTTATYFNSGGVLADAAINANRDSSYGSYPAGAVRQTVLEAPRTNQILWASDQTNAAWAKSNMTVATGFSGMRGPTSACRLTATAPTADLIQVLSAGSSLVRANSIWARRQTGSGQVELYGSDGATFQVLALTNTWTRYQIASPATTARRFEIVIRTSGDAIDVENAQLEDGAFATSEIQTTAVAVTRATDSYSLPFTTPPQELSFYLKFVEMGTIIAGKWLASITSAANADPELVFVYNTGYAIAHRNASGTQVTATAAVVPSIGQTVELLGRLYGDGSVDLTQSINGAAATSTAQTAANALANAWSAQLLWLNSDGSLANAGFTAIQSLKIVAGARSLTEMRAA